MPIKYKNNKTRGVFERKNGFDNCRNCGKQISPEITKSMYCLECNLRYSEQIRKQKVKNKC